MKLRLASPVQPWLRQSACASAALLCGAWGDPPHVCRGTWWIVCMTCGWLGGAGGDGGGGGGGEGGGGAAATAAAAVDVIWPAAFGQ